MNCPLRIQPWSQNRQNQTKSNQEHGQRRKAGKADRKIVDFNTHPKLSVQYLKISTVPIDYSSGCGKREAKKIWTVVTPEKAAPVTGTALRATY